MTTAIHTPPPATLSTLTPAERRAALAWIERDGASLRQVAAQLDLAADELLDILTQPNVAAFIEAADNIIHIRERILARYDDIDARQSLVAIAKNPDADHTTRLRAAITILQGPPPRRSAPAAPTVPVGPGSPTVPGGPKPDGSTINRTTPSPPGAPPATSNYPAAAQVQGRAQAPALPSASPNAPAPLNRAAGARHAAPATNRPIQTPRPASPAASGRPP